MIFVGLSAWGGTGGGARAAVSGGVRQAVRTCHGEG